MQPTAAKTRNTSVSFAGFLQSKAGLGIKWQNLLITTAVLAAFVSGRASDTYPHGAEASLAALRADVWQQQALVERLVQDRQQTINALATRLAELQAASTRIDALGERLAQMGQLSLDEFDFGEPAPVGGPADPESLQPVNESDLRTSVAELTSRLRRQSSQLDALQSLMVNRQFESDATPNGWPVLKGWISSRYGERNDPFTGNRAHHTGVDFAGTQGSDVVSVASGVVVWAGNRSGYGHTVEIDHGNGYQTRYAHNQDLEVQAGDHVTAGQLIARMGSSGRSSAPHVHFEVLQNGNTVNPAKFVGKLR